MPGIDLILAVDISTSAAKAILFDIDLRQLHMVRKPYGILTPHAGWVEQDPDTIFAAVQAAMRECIAAMPGGGTLSSVVFCSQLYDVMATSASGRPLTNLIILPDTRCTSTAQHLRGRPAAQEIFHRTGCPIEAIYPFVKIKWLKENQKFSEEVKFISIKEFVIFRLTGELLADWCIASNTGMFDLERQQWSRLALDELEITHRNLPELASPRTVLSQWKPDLARQIGIPSNTPLVIGSGDGPLASIGVGAFAPGVVAVNVGTSAAARLVVRTPVVDVASRLWTYVVDEGLWVLGGVVSSGGMVYEWFLKAFFSTLEAAPAGSPHRYAERAASEIAPGADGLIFIPYLSGEQSPAWRLSTRGVFSGLDLRHHSGHFTRAVLEGITRSIYRVTESLRPHLPAGQIREVRVTGGLSASQLWLQLAADMLGTVIAVPETTEGSARGAAMLALMALGARKRVEDFSGSLSIRQRVEARPEVHDFYERQYRYFLQTLEYSRNLSSQEIIP